MRVVNIRKDPYDVYVGRAGHGEDGYFGNPVVVGEKCSICGFTHLYPGATLPCFEKYFLKRIASDAIFKERVFALKGKTLGCFCAPKGGFLPGQAAKCHGQIIANWLETPC